MCVAIACIGNQTPSRQELIRGCIANPDGFGWGVVYFDGQYYDLEWNKTMDGETAIDEYLATVERLGDSVVASAFHARIATHGGTNLPNCHPFPVGGDERTLLFHNGMLPISAEGGRSDTRIFAEDVLPTMGGVTALEQPVLLDMVSNWAKGSKLVVLSIDPAVEYSLTIVNEDDGFWTDNVWFSNSSCQPYTASKWNGTLTKVAALQNVCPVCDQSVEPLDEVCSICWSCLDCELPSEDCLCYSSTPRIIDAVDTFGWDVEAF